MRVIEGTRHLKVRVGGAGASIARRLGVGRRDKSREGFYMILTLPEYGLVTAELSKARKAERARNV